MYPELALALGHSDTDVPSGSLVCVSDTLQNSGDFVLVHFLAMYLKSGWRVVLASHRQLLSHFASIVKKFNLNLSALEQTGQFKFINGLEHSIYPLPDPWTNFVSLVNEALTSSGPVSVEQSAPIEWKGTVLIWDGLSELLIQHPFEVKSPQAHALATVQQLYAQVSSRGVCWNSLLSNLPVLLFAIHSLVSAQLTGFDGSNDAW
jgi:hypothetical protein